MLVQEIMISKVESVSPGPSIQETARKMREMNLGSLPVLENGKLIGMITDRDICCRVVGEGREPVSTKVREIMSTDVSYCCNNQS